MTTHPPANGLLVVISGPSGVGKGTVIARLLERLPDARLSTSVTTRPARAGETDGHDYHFVDDAEFDRLVSRGGLLEWAEYAGARYGTPREHVETLLAADAIVLLEIEVQGALQIRDRIPDALLVFIAPPDLGELERRLSRRATEDAEQRRVRLETAREELASTAAFDEVVVNDDLEDCVEEIVALVLRHHEAPC